MAELKTRQNSASAAQFIGGIADPHKRADCRTLAKMMRKATGERARMWGTSIVGFGKYDYTYESGRSGSWMLTGFSPRKQNISIYIMAGFGKFDALMKKLGQYKTGKSCLYVKQLADVDEKVLEQLIDASVQEMRRMYES